MHRTVNPHYVDTSLTGRFRNMLTAANRKRDARTGSTTVGQSSIVVGSYTPPYPKDQRAYASTRLPRERQLSHVFGRPGTAITDAQGPTTAPEADVTNDVNRTLGSEEINDDRWFMWDRANGQWTMVLAGTAAMAIGGATLFNPFVGFTVLPMKAVIGLGAAGGGYLGIEALTRAVDEGGQSVKRLPKEAASAFIESEEIQRVIEQVGNTTQAVRLAAERAGAFADTSSDAARVAAGAVSGAAGDASSKVGDLAAEGEKQLNTAIEDIKKGILGEEGGGEGGGGGGGGKGGGLASAISSASTAVYVVAVVAGLFIVYRMSR
jgi:hypothetical protein